MGFFCVSRCGKLGKTTPLLHQGLCHMVKRVGFMIMACQIPTTGPTEAMYVGEIIGPLELFRVVSPEPPFVIFHVLAPVGGDFI